MKVYHDPGHGDGPSKPGTVAPGLVERDWVELMATDLATACPFVPHGFLRFGPVGPAYKDRAKEAKEQGADIVLLHHVNAGDEALHGLLTFVMPDDKLGMECAQAIVNAAPAGLRRKGQSIFAASPDDWTKRAYACLKNYADVGLPAVLIEWGFASNPGDRKILLSAASRPALCAAGYAGIARVFEVKHG